MYVNSKSTNKNYDLSLVIDLKIMREKMSKQ